MEQFVNDTSLKRTRRKLRIKATGTERLLWSQLRGKRLKGYKFRRQVSIGPYIVDFYVPALRLAIEIDGSDHFDTETAITQHKGRQEFLESYGIRFLRFQNHEIIRNLDSVVQTIFHYLP